MIRLVCPDCKSGLWRDKDNTFWCERCDRRFTSHKEVHIPRQKPPPPPHKPLPYRLFMAILAAVIAFAFVWQML